MPTFKELPCEPNPHHDLVFIFGSSADYMSEHNETTIVSSAKYMTDMQELYRFTERQFLEFDEIVPMRLNKEGNVVSPKLYFLLMAVCGQVESVTRHICKELGIPVKKNDGFSTLYNKLCGKFSLIKEQSVQIVMTRDVIRPFGETEKDIPSWWTSYNNVKHKIPEGMEHATARQTIYALGGLYLLMNLYQSLPRNPKDVLNVDNWFFGNNPMQRLPSNRFGHVPDVDYKSGLFILKSHFVQSG